MNRLGSDRVILRPRFPLNLTRLRMFGLLTMPGSASSAQIRSFRPAAACRAGSALQARRNRESFVKAVNKPESEVCPDSMAAHVGLVRGGRPRPTRGIGRVNWPEPLLSAIILNVQATDFPWKAFFRIFVIHCDN